MRRRRNNLQVSYWESATDAIVGLLMLVLLCLLLVILTMQLNYSYEHTFEEEGLGEYEYEETYDDWDDDGSGAYGNDWEEDDHEDDNGDDGSGGGGEAPVRYEYESESTIEEDGKSAVLVRVVDADTEKNIHEAGVNFEIQKRNGDLLTLSTHYPKLINYNRFATDENGQFYLPEKIAANRYSFHQITEVKGYEINSGVTVQVDKEYDWEDPLVVVIPLYPSKSTVRLHLTDENDRPISGTVGVYAKTDIVTYDGTVRLNRDELADTIQLDDKGYGESIQLYLGDYYLVVLSIPEGYVEEELDSFTLHRSGEKESEIMEITLPFTTVALTLRDMHTGQYLPNTEFTLYVEKSMRSRKLTTDAQGTILAQGLSKGTTYHLRQITTLDGYHMAEEEYVFYVDAVGLIDGLPQLNIDASNYTIRCAISVRDALLRKAAVNCPVELYRGETLVGQWNGEESYAVKGLEMGSYTIKWENKTQTITIADTEEVQEIVLPLWSGADYALIAAAAVFACFALVLGVKKILRREKKHGTAG